MMKILRRFIRNESGATAIEYGLIAALVSVALIAGAGTLGNGLNHVFNNIGTRLNTASSQVN